jgi:hypothetical protein
VEALCAKKKCTLPGWKVRATIFFRQQCLKQSVHTTLKTKGRAINFEQSNIVEASNPDFNIFEANTSSKLKQSTPDFNVFEANTSNFVKLHMSGLECNWKTPHWERAINKSMHTTPFISTPNKSNFV